MRKKSIIRSFLGCLTIAGASLFLYFSKPPDTSTCKESMDACCHEAAGNNKMIWENLSHQFFSSF